MARTRVPSPPLARALFVAMALMALALRVLVPAGYMAASTNDHTFAIVLCTGQGAMTVQPGQALPGHGDHDAPAKDGQQHAPCAFAGLTAGAVAPDLAAPVPVVFEAQADYLPAAAHDLAPGRGLPAPPPPARGPPSLLI